MKFKHVLLSLSFLLLLSSVVFADSNGGQSDENDHSLIVRSLNGFAAERTCAVSYVVGAIAIASNASNSSAPANLSMYQQTLNRDLSTLLSTAANGSKEAFKQKAEQLTDDLNAAVMAVKQARATVPSSLENATRQQLVDLRKARDTCMLQAKLQAGGARSHVMDVHLARYEKLMARLALLFHGLDTSGMQQVLTNAKTQVLDPYKALVANATSHKDVIAANQLYCLYEGCKNGTDFHLAAKFELAKLNSLLAYAKTNLNASANLSAKMQAELDTATQVVTSAGASDYTREQSEALWSALRAASIDFKHMELEVRRPIRAEAIRQNREERGERRQGRNGSMRQSESSNNS